MRLKTNLVIGVLFAALLAFVYFYEIRGGEDRRAESDKTKKLVDFAESEAKRLTIDHIDSLIVIEKVQDRWMIVSPVACEADQEAVDRYLRNLREVERDKVVEEADRVRDNPEVAQKYRLHAPRLKVVVETATGSTDTIWWGADSPTQRFVYVQQRGTNPEILTVQAWRFDNLDKGVFDLRDRRVLAFEQETVRELRLIQPQGTLSLSKEEGWRLVTPVAAPADQGAVDGLLDQLHQAQAKAFVPGTAAGAASYGLNTPILEVSLLLGEVRAEKRLRVGAQAPEGTYYAQDPSRMAVFTVDSSLVKQLSKTMFDLRDKQPLKFARDQVDHIELQRPGQQLAAAKDTAGVWSLVAPQRGPAKSWKFNNLLSQLEEVKVEQFVGEAVGDLRPYGLDAPRLRLVLQSGGKAALEVKLGEKASQVYLTKVGAPAVYRVAGSVLKDLDLQLQDVVQGAAADSVQTGQ